MSLIRSTRAALVSLAVLAPFSAAAIEYPIGTPHNIAGMEVAAVYLQPVEMEPEGMMAKASIVQLLFCKSGSAVASS